MYIYIFQIAVPNCMFTMFYYIVYHLYDSVYLSAANHQEISRPGMIRRMKQLNATDINRPFSAVCMPGASPPRWRVASRQSPRNDLSQAAGALHIQIVKALSSNSLQMSQAISTFHDNYPM